MQKLIAFVLCASVALSAATCTPQQTATICPTIKDGQVTKNVGYVYPVEPLSDVNVTVGRGSATRLVLPDVATTFFWPDNAAAEVVFPVQLSDSSKIENIELTIGGLRHAWSQDLRIVLKGAKGAKAVLWGGGGRNSANECDEAIFGSAEAAGEPGGPNLDSAAVRQQVTNFRKSSMGSDYTWSSSRGQDIDAVIKNCSQVDNGKRIVIPVWERPEDVGTGGHKFKTPNLGVFVGSTLEKGLTEFVLKIEDKLKWDVGFFDSMKLVVQTEGEVPVAWYPRMRSRLVKTVGEGKIELSVDNQPVVGSPAEGECFESAEYWFTSSPSSAGTTLDAQIFTPDCTPDWTTHIKFLMTEPLPRPNITGFSEIKKDGFTLEWDSASDQYETEIAVRQVFGQAKWSVLPDREAKGVTSINFSHTFPVDTQICFKIVSINPDGVRSPESDEECAYTCKRKCASCQRSAQASAQCTACHDPQGVLYAQCEKPCTTPGRWGNEDCGFACAACAPGAYSFGCSGFKSGGCLPCTARDTTPTSFKPSYGSWDSQCTPCAVCSETEFAQRSCSLTQNTLCRTCSKCGANEYSNATCTRLKDTSCTSCPPHSSSPNGSVSISQCVCDVGFGKAADGTCVPCGANCKRCSSPSVCLDCSDEDRNSSSHRLYTDTLTGSADCRAQCPNNYYSTSNNATVRPVLKCVSCAACADGMVRVGCNDDVPENYGTCEPMPAGTSGDGDDGSNIIIGASVGSVFLVSMAAALMCRRRNLKRLQDANKSLVEMREQHDSNFEMTVNPMHLSAGQVGASLSPRRRKRSFDDEETARRMRDLEEELMVAKRENQQNSAVEYLKAHHGRSAHYAPQKKSFGQVQVRESHAHAVL